PGRGRHNIWELAVHAAYWKYIVTRRITGASGPAFPHAGRNWFERPAKSDGSAAAQLERAWRSDLELLAETHAELRAVVSRLAALALDRPARGHQQTPSFMIEGIAMHDVYHAGQIQLLRKLTAH
ncbi:MAG TPA: DinB family protein, partial [Candidatus Acidoferrales bacterium]|nr:DinB family protein [Candidatus Acidoferrales bacterium]